MLRSASNQWQPSESTHGGALVNPLESALDLAGVGTWMLDIRTQRLHWCHRTAAMVGGTAANLGDLAAWLQQVHPGDRTSLVHLLERIRVRPTRHPVVVTFRYRRPDGRQRWLLARGRLEHESNGDFSVNGIVIDETERRQTEQRMRMLLGELQHRVKNVISMVRSLSTRTLANSTSLEDYGAHFDGRIGSLARMQGVLTRSPKAEIDLGELVHEEFRQLAAREGEQLQLTGETVFLRHRSAELIGLVIHELVTNAVKFGALSTPKGKVFVDWWVLDDPPRRLVLHWREEGVPLINLHPHKNGFGRELIEQGLPYELGATTRMDFAAGGLRCMIETPLDGHPDDSNPRPTGLDEDIHRET